MIGVNKNVKCVSITIFTFLMCLAGNSSIGAELKRSPYLLNQHQSGITIRWRTDSLIRRQSAVRVGDNPNKLDRIFKASLFPSKNKSEMNWIAPIRGLEPGKKYFYAIEADFAVIAGADKAHYFETLPDENQNDLEFTYVLLGDSGSNRPFSDVSISPFGKELSHPIQVRNGFRTFLETTQLNGIIMLGDNAYPIGTDREYQTAFFNVYKEELNRVPVWPCPGNHELDPAFISIFADPFVKNRSQRTDKFPLYYSFEVQNIHFVVLDPWKSWLETTTDKNHPGWQKQLQWFKADLKASDKFWTVLINHFPIYSDGDYNSDNDLVLVQLREMLAPIIDEHGIDLSISGHDHSYQRSYLVAEHYGPSSKFDFAKHVVTKNPGNLKTITKKSGARSGCIHVVAGSAGGTRGAQSLSHPVMIPIQGKRGMAVPSSFILKAKGNKLSGYQVDVNGQILDHFTLEKSP